MSVPATLTRIYEQPKEYPQSAGSRSHIQFICLCACFADSSQRLFCHCYKRRKILWSEPNRAQQSSKEPGFDSRFTATRLIFADPLKKILPRMYAVSCGSFDYRTEIAFCR